MLLRVAKINAIASELFFPVQQLIAPRTKLLSPRVVWHLLTKPLGRSPTYAFRGPSAPLKVMPSGQA